MAQKRTRTRMLSLHSPNPPPLASGRVHFSRVIYSLYFLSAQLRFCLGLKVIVAIQDLSDLT
jgi:hypothetical protein